MNVTNWNKAFKNLGAELVEQKLPMKERWPPWARNPPQIANERHLEFKEMPINSMYGKFYCPNPRCNSKIWNSTSCTTSMKYRYDDVQQRGEIIIESGMLRIIRICRRPGGQLISYYILKLDW